MEPPAVRLFVTNGAVFAEGVHVVWFVQVLLAWRQMYMARVAAEKLHLIGKT